MVDVDMSQLNVDISSLIQGVLSDLFNKFKPLIIILLILLVIYIIYIIIKFILNRIKEKRARKTYDNTNLILERLNSIEKKLDSLNSRKAKKVQDSEEEETSLKRKKKKKVKKK